MTGLKRKKPPGIEIPTVLREIRVDVAEYNKDCTVSFGGPGVGVFSLKGKKRFMEDTFKIVASCPNQIKGFFGVYDGHGGKKAAEFVAENLDTNIFEMLKNCSKDQTKEEAVEAGYLKTDKDFLKQGVSSGACCVTAIIEGDKIVISNLGDCRAVLCRSGVAEALTTDHRAGNNNEKKRIESKGGYVDMHRGAWRVHGVLSVSRSIGDAHLKDWVIAEPDTKIFHLSPDMEYLVLASDGLWEKVGNQEVVDIVMGSIQNRKKLGPINNDRDDNDGKIILVPKSTPVSSLQRALSIEKSGPKKHDQDAKYGKFFLEPAFSTIASLQRGLLMEKPGPKSHENDGSFLLEPTSSTVSSLPRALLMEKPGPKSHDQAENDGSFLLEPTSSTMSSLQRGLLMEKPGPKSHDQDENDDKFFLEPNPFISSKLQRASLTEQKKKMGLSPIRRKMVRKKEIEDGFPSENEGPPMKTQRVSVQYHDQENSNGNIPSNSCILVSACNELANLALSRGSLDDITVMIIDLNPFK